MVIEYKSVDVVGVNEVKDEGDGVITAYVSVTGVEDNVKDIIEPGTYQRTLNKRLPKGVWGHQWLQPTSRTLDAKELMPGDPDLPKELSNGDPWPKDAGALRIKMQFNLDTRRGREAYSDVKFFDKQQEWSIGYVVPPGGSYKDDKGVRHIKDLDLFEYSAVLFGAMSHARTASVKDAQIGMKLLEGVPALEIKSLEDALDLYRKEIVGDAEDVAESDFVGDESTADSDGEPDEADDADEEALEDDDDYVDDEFDEDDEEKSMIDVLTASMSVKELRTAYTVIGKVLDVIQPDTSSQEFYVKGIDVLVEAKAVGYDSIADAVDGIDVDIDPSDAKSMREAAEKLDWALKANDLDAAEESAGDLMDVLEKVMDGNSDDDISLKTVARTIADKTGGNEDDDEDYEDEDWEDDDDEDDKKGKKSFTASNGIEYKAGRPAGRQFGVLIGGSDLDRKERQEAFVNMLPNDALVALHSVLSDTRGNAGLKTIVTDEVDARLYVGELSEEKMNMSSARGGQDGRGGGRHVQAAEGRTPGSGRNFGETGRARKPAAKRLRKAVKGVKKPGVGKKTVNRVTGAKKPVNPMAGGDQTEYKRNFTAEQRQDAAKRGAAMPDASFPIENEKDLKNAIRACGRAKDTDAAKAHIKKRAKALGLTSMIPDEWKVETIDTLELKSLESFVAEIS